MELPILYQFTADIILLVHLFLWCSLFRVCSSSWRENDYTGRGFGTRGSV